MLLFELILNFVGSIISKFNTKAYFLLVLQECRVYNLASCTLYD
ncbi:hypothetical protein MIDIC_110130 [Alphaproteobacteria bacterium]